MSHTSKENVVLRCHLDPSLVYVIPNAIDASQFSPDPDNVSPKDTVNIVVMMRLVWRKGTHLLVELIPDVCRCFPYVHFIVGGDGPNRLALEEMRDRHQLQERVELLGAVSHCDVPRILTRGQIFLNTSLTEVSHSALPFTFSPSPSLADRLFPPFLSPPANAGVLYRHFGGSRLRPPRRFD